MLLPSAEGWLTEAWTCCAASMSEQDLNLSTGTTQDGRESHHGRLPPAPEGDPASRPRKARKTSQSTKSLLQQAASVPLPQLTQRPLSPMTHAAFRDSPLSLQPQLLADLQKRSYNDLHTSLHNVFADTDNSATDFNTGSRPLECPGQVVVVFGRPNTEGHILLERICRCKFMEQQPQEAYTLCISMTQLPLRRRGLFSSTDWDPL